jgi:hypothetical protein
LEQVGVGIFHAGEVKEGVCPSVCRVGFLEKVFHVNRDSFPAKTSQNRCWRGCTRELQTRIESRGKGYLDPERMDDIRFLLSGQQENGKIQQGASGGGFY